LRQAIQLHAGGDTGMKVKFGPGERVILRREERIECELAQPARSSPHHRPAGEGANMQVIRKAAGGFPSDHPVLTRRIGWASTAASATRRRLLTAGGRCLGLAYQTAATSR
jgi:hypothetical protein